MLDSDLKKENVYQQMQREHQVLCKKIRFGLFSHPIGLEPIDAEKKLLDKGSRFDRDNERLKNFSTNKTKLGREDLFSKAKFNSEYDEFVDPKNDVGRSSSLNLTAAQQNAFKPGGASLGLINRKPGLEGIGDRLNDSTISANKSMLQDAALQAINGGKGRNAGTSLGTHLGGTAPTGKNFMTRSSSGLFQSYMYEADPYEGPEQKMRKERQEHVSKFVGQSNAPFVANKVKTGRGLFDSPSGPQHAPDYTNVKTPIKIKETLAGPFRPNNPSKNGYNKTINVHPLYYEERENQREEEDALRDKIRARRRREKVWIPNTFEWTKPSPSVNQHLRNPHRDTSF